MSSLGEVVVELTHILHFREWVQNAPNHGCWHVDDYIYIQIHHLHSMHAGRLISLLKGCHQPCHVRCGVLT
jgi:hypothetical protein